MLAPAFFYTEISTPCWRIRWETSKSHRRWQEDCSVSSLHTSNCCMISFISINISETEDSDSGLLGFSLSNFVLPLWSCVGKRYIYSLSYVWAFREYVLSPPKNILPYFMQKMGLLVVSLIYFEAP